MAKKVVYTKNKVVKTEVQQKLEKQKTQEIIDAMFRKNLGQLARDNPEKSKDELYQIFIQSKKIKNILNNQDYGIAPNLAVEVLDKDKVILKNSDRVKAETIYKNELEEKTTKDSFDSIKEGFFGRLLDETQTDSPFNLPKNQTGEQLIKEVIHKDSIYFQEIKSSSRVNYENLHNAYQKLKDGSQFIIFDTETLGGNNTQGLFQLDKVYDISYNVGSLNDPDNLIKKSFIMGITAEERDQLLKEIYEMADKGEKSSRSHVLKKMAVIYGRSDIEKGEDGLFRMVKQWDGYSPSQIYDKEDFKKGIEKLYEIGEEYRKASNGNLTPDKKAFAEMLKVMSNKENVLIGHNSSVADVPWLNIEAAKIYNTLNEQEKKEFLNTIGWDKMQNLDVTGRHLDTLHLMREASDTNLLRSIYSKSGDNTRRMKNGFSPYAQEAIAEALYGSAGQAHTSMQDIENLLNILTYTEENSSEMLIDKLMQSAQEKVQKRGIDLKGKQVKADGSQIFMSTRSMQFRDGVGALSFTIDPVSGEVRTSSGWDISAAKGGAKKNTYGQNPFKKNRFFTLDNYMQVDLNSEEWSNLAPALHELGGSQAYVAKLTPIYDKSTSIKQDLILEQPMFIVAQTEEQLQYALNSRSAHVGEIVGDKIVTFEEAKPLIRTQRMRHGGEVVGEAREDLVSAIKTSTYNEVGDKARRKIDDMTLSSYERLGKLKRMIEDKFGEELTGKQVKDKVLEIVQSHDKKISKQVSEGKVVNVTLDDVKNLFDNRTGRNMNELNNIVHMLNYYDHFNEIGDVVAEVVKDTYGSKELQDVAFAEILKNLKAEASKEMIDQKLNAGKTIKELYEGTTDKFVFAKDLNTFTFNLPNLFGQEVNFYDNLMSLSDADTSIVFDFNNDQSFYGLAESIHKKMNGREFIGDKSSLGYKRTMRDVLQNFAEHVSNTKEYAGIFDELLTDPLMLEDPTTMSMRMYEIVDNYRKIDNNAAKGLPIDFSTKNIFKEEEVLKYIKDKHGDSIKDYVRSVQGELPSYKVINYKTGTESFDFLYDYIDSTLINFEVGDTKYSYNQMSEYLQNLGFEKNGIEAKYLSANVEQTRKAYRDYLEDFMRQFSQNDPRGRNGVEFVFDKEKKSLVMQQGKKSIAIDSMLPKIEGTGTGVRVQTGNMTNAFMGILNLEALGNVDEIASIDPSKISIQSSVHYALKDSQRKFGYYAKKGAEKGDMIEQAKRAVKSIGGAIYGDVSSPLNNKVPHVSPTIGNSPKEGFSFLTLDRKDLYNRLPAFARGGLLDGILPDDLIEELIKKDSFLPGQMQMKEAVQIAEYIDEVAYKLLSGNEHVKDVLGNVNYNAMKKTAHDKGHVIIGDTNIAPFADIEANGRPVAQSLTIRRSKEQLEESIKKARGKGILKDMYHLSVDEAISTKVSHSMKTASVKGIGQTTDSFVSSILNISDLGYKKILSDYLKENEVNEAVAEAMKGLNLTEQEKIMDGRVADTMMDSTNITMLKDPTDNPYLADMNTRYKKASPVFEMVDGKVVMKYGDGLNIKAKDVAMYMDGFSGLEAKVVKENSVLEFGYFSEGMLLSEQQVNKFISNAASIEEAREMLEANFGKSGFYLRSQNAAPYVKVIHGANEKDMTRKLLMGIGTVDEQLKTFLEKTDMKGNIGDILGVDDLEKTMKKVYDKNKKKAKKAGFNSYDELMKSVYNERYKLTDTVQDMLQKQLDIGEGVSFLVAHDKVKHKSVGTVFREHIATMTNHLIKTGEAKDAEEAAKMVLSDLNQYKVFGAEQGYVKGSTIILPESLRGVVETTDMNNVKTTDFNGIHIKRFQQMVEEQKSAAKNKKRYDGLFTAGVLNQVSYKDEVIGSLTLSVSSQVKDIETMSSSASLEIDLKGIEARIKKIRSDINARPDLADEYRPYLEELEAQKRAIKSGIKNIEKGRTYGRRDIQALGLEKNDLVFMENIINAFGEVEDIKKEDSMFQRIMGHMLKRDSDGNAIMTEDGRYLFKDGSKGKATLSKHVENIKSKMLLGKTGDTILNVHDDDFTKVIEKRFKDEHVRKSILNLFEKHEEMSVEAAERIYGATTGDLATQFNSKYVQKTDIKVKNNYLNNQWLADMETLEKAGFAKISLDEIAQETGYNARTTVDNEFSIFKRNSLIDLGEDFGDNRYIAMGYVANAATENNVIASNAQSKIGSLMRSAEEYRQAKIDNKPDLIEKAKARVIQKADELREQIYEDNMGKYGQYAQLNKVEANMSFNAKTSSFFYMDENTFDELEAGERKVRLQKMAENFGESSPNYEPLRRAQIAGMTLEDHYRNGRYYNVRFVGEEAFEKMELFKKENIRSIVDDDELKKFTSKEFLEGIDNDAIGVAEQKRKLADILDKTKDIEEQRKEVLKYKLRTEGIMADTVRPPVIYTGSTGPSMVFLDDTLKGNQSKVPIEAQLAYNGDNDGDSIISNIIYKKTKLEDGTYRIETSLNSSDEMFKDNLAYMTRKATGENRYYRQEAVNIAAKDYFRVSNNSNLSALALGDYVMGASGTMPPKETMELHENTLKEFFESVNKANDSSYGLQDLFGDNIQVFDDHLRTLKESGEDISKYLESYTFYRQNRKTYIDTLAKEGLAYTGHVNKPLFQAREIMDLRFSQGQVRAQDLATSYKTFSVIEQKIISSKKAEFTTGADSFTSIENKMKHFTDAFNNLIDNNSADAAVDMRRWLLENQDIKEGLVKVGEQLAHEGNIKKDLRERYFELRAVGKDLKTEEVVNDAGETVVKYVDEAAYEVYKAEKTLLENQMAEYVADNVVSNLKGLNGEQIREMRQSYNAGSALAYKDRAFERLVRYEGDEGMAGAAMDLMMDTGISNIKEDTPTFRNKVFNANKNLDDIKKQVNAFEPDMDSASRQAGNKVLESMGEALKHLKKPKGGKALLALTTVGAVMAAGAVGGNPSEDAGLEAAKMAQVSIQDLDRMSIQNQPASVQQTNRGYVININGKGNAASVNRASNKIAKTMSNSFSSNVNINMNINRDNGSLVNDRDIEQFITDAIIQ